MSSAPIAAALSLALLAGCGGASDATGPSGPPIASLTILVPDTNVWAGQNLDVQVVARTATGATVQAPAVAYAVSPSAAAPLAVVSQSGVVSTSGVGTVWIHASFGSVTDSAMLTITPNPSGALAVSALSACALDVAGAAYCWGNNAQGQLGTGDLQASLTPVRSGGDQTYVQLSAGDGTVCGVTNDGSVYCWGNAFAGLLAPGADSSAPTPLRVSMPVALTHVSVGAGSACGVSAAGAAYCWGRNSGLYADELGTGDTLSSAIPEPVSIGVPLKTISVGLEFACGLDAGGIAYCWGQGLFGALGTGDTAAVPAPVRVTGGITFASLRAGAAETCGIATAGGAYCWGQDYFGSLGTGQATSVIRAFEGQRLFVLAPGPVDGGASLVSVRPSRSNSIFSTACGLAADGSAYCWGANHSGALTSAVTAGTALTTCTFNSTSFPCTGTATRIAGPSGFRAIATGGETVCGIATDHTLYCWGRGDDGQLGDGAGQNSNAPVVVAGGLKMP